MKSYEEPLKIIKDNMLIAAFCGPLVMTPAVILLLLFTVDPTPMLYLFGSVILVAMTLWPLYGLENRYSFVKRHDYIIEKLIGYGFLIFVLYVFGRAIFGG